MTERPDLAFPFLAVIPMLLAGCVPAMPSLGWGLALLAVAFAAFGLAALPIERAVGNRSGPVSALLDACSAPALAAPVAVVAGGAALVPALVLRFEIRPLVIGVAVLAAHLGAVEAVRAKWRARPVDPAADRSASPRHRWTPDATMRGLEGGPLPADEVFFTEPPAGIGPVRHAGSTLRAEPGPRCGTDTGDIAIRLVLVLGPAGGVVAVLVDGVRLGTMLVLAVLGIALALYEVWRLGCPRHVCAFVGRDGVARVSQRWPGEAPILDEMLLFADAGHAYALEHRRGVSHWFDYWWETAEGIRVFRLWGERSFSDRTASLPVRFARAAYAIWLDERRRRLGETFQAGEMVHFPLRGGGGFALDDAGLTVDHEGRRHHAPWGAVTSVWRDGALILDGLARADQPGRTGRLVIPGVAIADRDLLDALIIGLKGGAR